MKTNGNDKVNGGYYIGVDVGTDSVGWAATDRDYNLLRLRGKDAWGIRLLDEGSTSEKRRMFRTNRRRMQRRKWRLSLLRGLFSQEIAKVDPGFYQRMDESSKVLNDKSYDIKYTLFINSDFTDKDYYRDYPTVYHLRNELMSSDKPYDVRLVYLAIHHIIKSRGHFLYSLSANEDITFTSALNDYIEIIKDRFDIELSVNDEDNIKAILCDKNIGKRDKFIKLKNLMTFKNCADIDASTEKNVCESLIKLCASNTVGLSKLFFDCTFDDKLSVAVTDGEDKLAQVYDMLGDDSDILYAAKAVYDRAMLDSITNNYDTLSKFKMSQYKEHKDNIDLLKEYVKKVLKDKALAHEIFNAPNPKKEGRSKKATLSEEDQSNKKAVHNYAAYSRYKKGDADGKVSQEDFCKFLKKKLGDRLNNADEKYSKIKEKIDNGTFAPKLRSSDNGIIPNSLHRKELEIILNNASKYLPFLNEKDESGLSVSDKIIAIFDYKLPYYIGPLKGGWAVRKSGKEKEKILPWNIDEIIDSAASAEQFINRMTSICTYTGDDVLPQDSLLYSEFCVLNEINNIKLNGNAIDVATKKKIYDELFIKSRKKVTKKSIMQFLKAEGLASGDEIIEGIDNEVASGMRSYHDLKDIIDKTSYDTVEEIIRHIVLLGNDKKMLSDWLKSNTSLCADDIKRVCKLKYNKWGRLSNTFLTRIYDVDRQSGTGELISIIDMLRNTNDNLMKLLSDRYDYAKNAAEYRSKKLGKRGNPREMVDELYVSPKIRRSIWQAMRIIDEITDIKKSAPQKIFIEVARDKNDGSKKGKRTSSRKKQLLDLYLQCERQSAQLFNYIDKEHFNNLYERLKGEKDDNSMGKHLFLYYRQLGKCMYSGEPIDISSLKDKRQYDIDHIFPRSKIKDDSFDNTVLVKSKLNRDKTDVYPIEESIRNKMYAFWMYLHDIGAISSKKLSRLIRHTPLTEEERAEFINRQLVETRQSTKALADILGDVYGKNKIVYSKAANVSDFRDCFDMLKCRDVNDCHHAQDAYLNIAVGNYFDTRFTDKFRKNIANEKYNLKTDKLYAYDVKGAWVAGESGTIATVRKMMLKSSVLYSRMPIEVKGKLFEQPLKKKDNLIPLKVGQDTAVYGGYNKPKGAYWALVERIKRQKKVVKTTRSLEPVLIMDKQEYEQSPQTFAEKNWLNKDDEIKVIIPKILKYSLFELDGTRVHITGRTGDRLICIHANQLHVKYEDIIKFRKISKYVNRCKKANKTLEAYPDDGVDADTCIYLYDLIIDKLKQPAYAIVPSVCEYMESLRDNFICQDTLIRCKTLLQCLNALRCNAVYTSFKDLGGSNKVGIILTSKTISNLESAYLINQSPTGLYEKKIDLLH
ncbi:MAG: type II CRISPR RNA-guided endonuclease Cas9 [Clostridia bacterium]|nr:type II CRISPR RNA-guided endonuclease Cas9 [Clostridia bacterium]